MTRMYTWDDAGEIAEALCERFPDLDPLSVTFPRLHRMVAELDEFDDDPNGATEHRLEDIQMAWYELVEE